MKLVFIWIALFAKDNNIICTLWRCWHAVAYCIGPQGTVGQTWGSYGTYFLELYDVIYFFLKKPKQALIAWNSPKIFLISPNCIQMAPNDPKLPQMATRPEWLKSV